jgi:hypothetical protein
MWQLLRQYKEFSLLIIACFLVLIIFIAAIMLRFGSNETTSPNQLITPTPATFLSEQEERLPTAKPQPFRNDDVKETGSLVVTSTVPNVRVFLDMTDHPEEEDPIPSNRTWPENITPFTVREMPVGEHFLFAFKPPDYDTAVMKYTIKKNEVTRVNIELIPLRTTE